MTLFSIDQRQLAAWIFIGSSILLLRPLLYYVTFASEDASGQSSLLLSLPLAAVISLLCTSIAFLVFGRQWFWRASLCLAVLISFSILLFANLSLL